VTRALDNSKKEHYLLVQFTINNVPYRFTNWGTTLDPTGENWISMPSMEVKWPKNTGTLSPGGCMITVVTDANSTIESVVNNLLSDGTPTAPVDVEIREVIRPVVIGELATQLFPFKGQVLRAVRNAGGRSKRARFEVQNVKSRLDVPLGLPCNHHCVWRFMGRGCSVQGGAGSRGPQFISERRVRTISSINGKELTLSTDPAITGSKSFRYGYAQRNNIRISIQDWDSGDPTKIILRQQPPTSWSGQTVELVPGCDKTLSTCQSAWGNEDNFGGIGFAVPAYNPHYEDGA
jgi:hypothetical protein